MEKQEKATSFFVLEKDGTRWQAKQSRLPDNESTKNDSGKFPNFEFKKSGPVAMRNVSRLYLLTHTLNNTKSANNWFGVTIQAS